MSRTSATMIGTFISSLKPIPKPNSTRVSPNILALLGRCEWDEMHGNGPVVGDGAILGRRDPPWLVRDPFSSGSNCGTIATGEHPNVQTLSGYRNGGTQQS